MGRPARAVTLFTATVLVVRPRRDVAVVDRLTGQPVGTAQLSDRRAHRGFWLRDRSHRGSWIVRTDEQVGWISSELRVNWLGQSVARGLSAPFRWRGGANFDDRNVAYISNGTVFDASTQRQLAELTLRRAPWWKLLLDDTWTLAVSDGVEGLLRTAALAWLGVIGTLGVLAFGFAGLSTARNA